jgi:hypothetical protein
LAYVNVLLVEDRAAFAQATAQPSPLIALISSNHEGIKCWESLEETPNTDPQVALWPARSTERRLSIQATACDELLSENENGCELLTEGKWTYSILTWQGDRTERSGS